LNTFTLLIFIMGIATVVLSVVVSVKFASYSRELKNEDQGLSRAISLQLLGEAVIGLGTLVFATAAHFGWLPDWPLRTQSTLRFVMFAATSVTTYHLFVTLRKIR
jgi:sterol desaturase/sphingolipid hydroxylase (fatty acid hydroxylase superfamily)